LLQQELSTFSQGLGLKIRKKVPKRKEKVLKRKVTKVEALNVNLK
jgi:hypothetical protein